jgi:hypothetical protein
MSVAAAWIKKGRVALQLEALGGCALKSLSDMHACFDIL